MDFGSDSGSVFGVCGLCGRSVTRASYEIMSRSFCCLRETETADESLQSVAVVRGFWRQRCRRRRRASRQIDFSAFHYTAARTHSPPLSFSSHTHAGERAAQVSRVLDQAHRSRALPGSPAISVPLSLGRPRQARTFIQGERARAGISSAAHSHSGTAGTHSLCE